MFNSFHLMVFIKFIAENFSGTLFVTEHNKLYRMNVLVNGFRWDEHTKIY